MIKNYNNLVKLRYLMKRSRKIYNSGYKARQEGQKRSQNPFVKNESPKMWGIWDDGWKDGKGGYKTKKFDARSEKDQLKKCGE